VGYRCSSVPEAAIRLRPIVKSLSFPCRRMSSSSGWGGPAVADALIRPRESVHVAVRRHLRRPIDHHPLARHDEPRAVILVVHKEDGSRPGASCRRS
jgi:hypothetical protein